MRDEQSIETEATELLRTLIRNACVNDGTPASGQKTRNCDGARGLLRGRGGGVRALHLGARPREPHRAHRGLATPRRPRLLLMGHTDVVPVNPYGWERDPFGGELVDGVVWGRGRHRHAEPHQHDGGGDAAPGQERLPPARHADLPGGRGRGGGRQSTARSYLSSGEPDAVKADYVITESGGVPIPTGKGHVLARDGGREGRQLAAAHGGGHARPRLAPVPHRQRPGDRRRGRAAHRGLPAQGAHPRRVARVRDGWIWRPSSSAGAHRSRPRAGDGARMDPGARARRPTPARTPRSRRTSCTAA